MKYNFLLDTKDGYKLAVYTKGNFNSIPVIFLHGGPGGHISEESFSFFDLNKYFVIAFDQRGCGKSIPFGSVKNNTIFDSIYDIELIRKHFNIEKFIVFGGSYGSTLALAYAINYPTNVFALVLRGIFLARDEDVKWLYQEGASFYYPEAHKIFKDYISEDKQTDLVSAYYEIFVSNDEKRKKEACKIWSDYESSIIKLIPEKINTKITNNDISIALLECHYFKNKVFQDDNYILNNVDKIKDIKTYIVHGRYDIDCRPVGAYILHNVLPNSTLYFSDAAGHSPYDKNNFIRLKEIMDNLEI